MTYRLSNQSVIELLYSYFYGLSKAGAHYHEILSSWGEFSRAS